MRTLVVLLLLTVLPILGMCSRIIYYCDYITVNENGVITASGEYSSTFFIDTDNMILAYKIRKDSAQYRIKEIQYNRDRDMTSYVCISQNGSEVAFMKDAKSILFCPSVGTVMIYKIQKIKVD